MSRIYEALRRAEIKRDHPGDAMPQGSARPAAPAAEVRPPPRTVARKEPGGADPALLFHADPMENVARWVQTCFPGAELSREDAIRQWLGMASDSRAQAAIAGREREESLNQREYAEAAPREGRKKHEEQPQEIFRAERDPKATPSSHYGRTFVNFVAYSALAILLVRIVWLMPLNKAFSEADSPLRVGHALAAGAKLAPKALAAPISEPSVVSAASLVGAVSAVSAAQPSAAEEPGRIEGISIACEDAQPCVVINTQGKNVPPALSRLTDPDRLVLDFKNVLYLPEVRRIAVGRGSVEAVRIGGDQKARLPVTRVVVDLEAKSDYELQSRANGFMLKIYPRAATQPK